MALESGREDLLLLLETRPVRNKKATGISGYRFPGSLTDASIIRWVCQRSTANYPQGSGSKNVTACDSCYSSCCNHFRLI